MLRVFLWIVAIIVILIWICFGYHRYKLRKEEKLKGTIRAAYRYKWK